MKKALLAFALVACSEAVSPSSTPPGPDGTGPADGAPDAGTTAPADAAKPTDGKTLTFLTLNMHGYHPMGEKERFFEDKSGNLTDAPSSTFYFTREEMDRGNARRLDALAADLKTRLPDVVALQEVGAGSPDVARDCTTFENVPLTDSGSANTALRLAARLAASGYSAKVACRGNIGWSTDASTFKDERIVRAKGDVVFDFDENPYPGGVIVEGFGVMWRAPITLIEAKKVDPAAELVALEVDASTHAWVLVLDVHGAHKVAHFEMAVGLRKVVSDYLATAKNRALLTGVVFLGDFNARANEPAFVPWPAPYTNADDDDAFTKLAADLRAENASSYKTFATLPEGEASTRIDAAIGSFRTWLRTKPDPLVMTPALPTADIDQLFFSGLSLDTSREIYTNDDDHDLAGTYSDHPGVLTTLRLNLPR